MEREGRKLVKGCKAIWILAPNLKKQKAEKPEDDDQDILSGFRLIKVFDIAGTEPLPEEAQPEAVAGVEA